MLRGTARRTWRYFDDFVGPQTALVAAGQFQETPTARNFPAHVADEHRACGCSRPWRRTTLVTSRSTTWWRATWRRSKRSTSLERFEGHLLNWYDISTLEPLRPRYVSTVDSGNLLASLWTLESQLSVNWPRGPCSTRLRLRGLADTLDVLRQIPGPAKEAAISNRRFCRLAKLTTGAPDGSGGSHSAFARGRPPAKATGSCLPRGRNRSAHLLGATSPEAGRCLECGHRQISAAGGNPRWRRRRN